MQDSTAVLHVDDEPSFGELTATFLEQQHDQFTVETITGVDEGLERIADGPPDCVVSDYNMPGMDGLEFLQAVIEADRTRLQELFENLYRNSVEHSSTSTRTESVNGAEHGGEALTVSVGPTEGGFYVADTGPGIPEAEREEIFEAGYSTSAGGTGFGLRIVEQIAEAHGWEITVTESEQGGARFEFTGCEPVDPSHRPHQY